MILCHATNPTQARQTDSLFDADEGVRGAGEGADVKVERASVASTACKIDGLNLIESDVKWWLRNEDETSLKWVQEAGDGLVRTCYRLCTGVSINTHTVPKCTSYTCFTLNIKSHH